MGEKGRRGFRMLFEIYTKTAVLGRVMARNSPAAILRGREKFNVNPHIPIGARIVGAANRRRLTPPPLTEELKADLRAAQKILNQMVGQ